MIRAHAVAEKSTRSVTAVPTKRTLPSLRGKRSPATQYDRINVCEANTHLSHPMPLKITIKESQVSTLSKISFFLFGIFISCTIFALCLKLFQEAGIWISILLALVLTFLTYYFRKKWIALKLIGIGIFSMLIFSIGLYIFIFHYLIDTLSMNN